MCVCVCVCYARVVAGVSFAIYGCCGKCLCVNCRLDKHREDQAACVIFLNSSREKV